MPGFPDLSRIKWFDRECNEISMWKACQLLAEPEYRIVKQEMVGTYEISTVWIGIFIGLGQRADERPLIFETMVFTGQISETNVLDPATDIESIPDVVEQHRWATEAEAVAGHEALALLLRATIQTEEDVLGTPEPLGGTSAPPVADEPAQD